MVHRAEGVCKACLGLHSGCVRVIDGLDAAHHLGAHSRSLQRMLKHMRTSCSCSTPQIHLDGQGKAISTIMTLVLATLCIMLIGAQNLHTVWFYR